jgi:hypothetical protein
MTEIAPYPELAAAGALPPELQSYTEFAIGVAVRSSRAAAAGAVAKFLTSTEAAPIFRAKFVEVR